MGPRKEPFSEKLNEHRAGMEGLSAIVTIVILVSLFVGAAIAGPEAGPGEFFFVFFSAGNILRVSSFYAKSALIVGTVLLCFFVTYRIIFFVSELVLALGLKCKSYLGGKDE